MPAPAPLREHRSGGSATRPLDQVCLYGANSSTTVRSTNSGGPSKISAITALAACSPS